MGFSEGIERMNRKLRRYIGAPPLGPYNEAPLAPTQSQGCPLCGKAMSQHEVERREGRPTQVHCPAA